MSFNRNSYLDIQALAECDPGIKSGSFSVDDDDTEMQVSLRSSLDGTNTIQTSSVFERDSGVGTLREDYESEIETLSRNGGHTKLRQAVYSSLSPQHSFRNSHRKHRIKEKRSSVNRFTDFDGSDENSDVRHVTDGRTIKLNKKRKVSLT